MYGGKKPWELANDVEFGTESMTWTRSQAAVLYLLPDQTARSEPPEKTGAGFGPFSLGIGKEAQLDLPTALAGKVPEAHGPSMYMSSLPRAKSSFGPPEVAPDVAELGLADVLGRGDMVGQVQVDVELDARLGLRRGQLRDPLAVLLGGDLAARAPDEAGHGRGVIGGRAQAVGARVLGHQLLRVGDQVAPRWRAGW